jgi:hypothetical protein
MEEPQGDHGGPSQDLDIKVENFKQPQSRDSVSMCWPFQRFVLYSSADVDQYRKDSQAKPRLCLSALQAK